MNTDYVVKHLVDEGSYGRVYKVKNTRNPKQNLVVKVCLNEPENFKQEVEVMKKVN